ncbi:MAG: arylsulfatase [Cyclobacteriaceae bacterium]
MIISQIASLILIIIISFPAVSQEREPTAQRPNIILIMSDDMGYADLSPYGGEIRTPNLNKLAEEGVRFTQFYNTARCCPTRASLLTGLYPHQTGIGHMTNYPGDPTAHDYGLPGYRGVLNKTSVTIAEVLKEAGYNTLMTGKWHLGFEKQEQWPLQRGFDQYYGVIPGACNYFHPTYPRGITYGNDTISITDEDYYTTDAFTDYAMQFIDESVEQSNDTPFFLYVAYNAPHWPLNAPQEDIDRYRGKYMDGWQKLRTERYERMKKMGLVDKNWELSPQDSRDWDSLTDEKKQEMDLRMAIYAAQIDRMDQNIGKLIDHLTEKNILDNTIIIFLNDNGACAEFDELGSGPAEQLSTEEGYVLSYGRAWANASNTPYREYKHWLHEGGIATPLIVHWPQGIASSIQGKMIKHYGFLPDIMATCLELADADYPQEYQGQPINPVVGKSLLPLLEGQDQPIHTEPIFWEHEGNKAVRLGNYKLVQDWEEDNWELYNLDKDRTEMHDLATQMPEKVAKMQALYEEWASNNKVEPWSSILKIMEQKKSKP